MENILRNPDWMAVLTDQHEYEAEDGRGLLEADGVRIETALQDGCLRVSLTANETPVRLIRLRWRAAKRQKARCLGGEWERGYGDMGWEGIIPYRAMPWYCFADDGEAVTGYGVMVRAASLCFWQVDPDGVSLWMDVRNGGEGVILGGRTLNAADVVCEQYTGMSAFEATRAFCRRMCPDPIFPEKAVYGANNWYYAYGNSSEQEILNDTALIARLTEGVENRPYMVVDDGWERDRHYRPNYIGGPWVGNEKFPDMPGLPAKMRALGVIPGVWMRPLQHDTAEVPPEARFANGCLDPSHPASLAQIKADISRLCDWGFRLIKHDFSTFDIFGVWGFEMRPLMTADGWHFYDRSRTSAEIVVALYRTIYEAAKPTGSLILGCNAIGHLGAGLMHMNRVGDDTSGLMFERSLRMGVNSLACQLPQHRTFFDIDADCLGITEALPWERNREWGRLLAKSGTSLFVSCKPGVMTANEEEELSAMLKRNADQSVIAEPLDWQDTPLPEDWQTADGVEHFDWYGRGGLRAVNRIRVDWDAMNGRAIF